MAGPEKIRFVRIFLLNSKADKNFYSFSCFFFCLYVAVCIYVDSSSSLYVTEVICFASVYHTNMNCLSTTPTQSLLHHAHANFEQTGTPQRVDCLTRLWE